MDTLDSFIKARPPTAARPLLGMTILLVEDSRFSAEAFRLLCLRSGARIRRADTLLAAHKHLRVYCPTTVIVDAGLPDGSGIGLIEELAQASPRIEVILGTSGDPGARSAAMAAGADGFLEKPINHIGEFQAEVLRHLPKDRQPNGPRPVGEGKIDPDPIALRNDLEHAVKVIEADGEERTMDYVAQFIGGLARSAGDPKLMDMAENVLRESTPSTAAASTAARNLHKMLLDRIASTPRL